RQARIVTAPAFVLTTTAGPLGPTSTFSGSSGRRSVRSTWPDGNATASSSLSASAVTSATGAPPPSRAVAQGAEASAARTSASATYLTHALRRRTARRSELRHRVAEPANGPLCDQVDVEDRLVGASVDQLAQALGGP